MSVENIDHKSPCCVVHGDGESLGDWVGDELVLLGEVPGLAQTKGHGFI